MLKYLGIGLTLLTVGCGMESMKPLPPLTAIRVKALCNTGGEDFNYVILRPEYNLSPVEQDALVQMAEKQLCKNTGVFKLLPRAEVNF